MKDLLTPIEFCTGEGSERSPYTAPDGPAGLQTALDSLSAHGGAVRLPAARYDLTKSIEMNLSGTCIAGDVWACNTDPNGVFETPYGAKLRVNGKGFPALRVGTDHLVSGCLVREVGVQGDIVGMDTSTHFDIADPTAAAGLVMDAVRTDQCTFTRMSFCGLGAGIAVAGNAEVDACRFEDCNTDGCGVGLYFSPHASYYARVQRCVMADSPYYGAFVDGRGKHIHNLEITETHFVRNGGCLTPDMPQPAAVSLLQVSSCAVERNNFDDPGTFWYYEPTATANNQRQPRKQTLVALHVSGNRNRIRDNVFQHSKGTAVILEGDCNVMMNNITDGDVIVSGKGNVICGLALLKDARLILRNAQDTVISGVPEDRIVRE